MSTGLAKKRRVYDLSSKLQIIAYAEKHGNRAAGRFYNIPESCIRLWRKNLLETDSCQGSISSESLSALSTELPELPVPVAKVLPVAIVSLPEKADQTNNIAVSSDTSTCASDLPWQRQLDEELRNYVRQLYEDGSPVLLDEIMLKTYDIIMSLNISRHDFEINREWVKTFLNYRSSVSCRISKSPRIVKEIETKLYRYHSVVTQLRKQHNYPLNQIGNAHQVKIFLDFPPSNEKFVAVMLCATADGVKLPPFIVFKCDCILKKTLPRNVIVRTEENGNMTAKLMTEWYKLVWGCRTGMEYNPRAMLTLDYSVSHLLTEDWLADGNTDLIVIPKGMNLFPQPLNVHVHKAFKDNLRWECEKWLLSQGRLKSASASLILYWIAGAWRNVSEQLIRDSFKNCHLSSDLESLKAAIYSISDNYVVFGEEISVSGDVSLGVTDDGNNSSALLSQQTDLTVPNSNMPSSSIVMKSGIATEVPVASTLADIRKQIQDPLAVGAYEERNILSKLLRNIKMEVQSEDQGSETSTTLSKVANQHEVASSLINTSLIPPKGQVMLMMHNGNIVMLQDALPSTVEQML